MLVVEFVGSGVGGNFMWPFGGRQTECPVEPDMQGWVDGRFAWLQEQFGEDVPRTIQVMLPTPQFFPDAYGGRLEDAQAMLNRIATHMGTPPERFALYLFKGEGAAGLYHRPRRSDNGGDARAAIGIEESQLTEPMSLVATLAHEIGHELLLGQNRLQGDEQDHEPVTDLLTVFFGMGIFSGNAAFDDKAWSDGTFHHWRVKRQGYLNQTTFGYAMARFAFTRGEFAPKWMKHVRPDVRVHLKNGLKHLVETRGSSR